MGLGINKIFLQTQSEGKPASDPNTEVLEKEDEALDKPWKLILYDDDIHTFDEVINQLLKALRCGQEKAEALTYKVHNDGKATVYVGPFEECLKRNSILREIQLITEIKG